MPLCAGVCVQVCVCPGYKVLSVSLSATFFPSLSLSLNAANVSRTCGYARISAAHAAYTQCGQSATATLQGESSGEGGGEEGVRKLQHWQDLRAQFVANSLALLLHYIKNKSQWQTSRRLYSLSFSLAFCHAPSCCCLCRQLLCKVIKMLNVNGAAREREREGEELLLLLLLHFSHFHNSQQSLTANFKLVARPELFYPADNWCALWGIYSGECDKDQSISLWVLDILKLMNTSEATKINMKN